MKSKAQPTIAASDFKTRCLEILDQVNQSRKEVIITKRGKPVARLVPVEQDAPTIFDILAGTVTYHGDIVGPMNEVWDADA